MKKSIVKRLKKEGRIKVVNPSKDVCLSYLEKSKNSFKSGSILLGAKLYEDSISMFYYSMYDSLLALLFFIGIKSENHSFSIFLLDYLFDRKDLFNMVLSSKKERIEKQYYVNSNFREEDLINLRNLAEDFNLEMNVLIDSIGIEKINFFRNKFMELIK